MQQIPFFFFIKNFSEVFPIIYNKVISWLLSKSDNCPFFKSGILVTTTTLSKFLLIPR